MATEQTKNQDVKDISIEEKLKALYHLQKVSTEIDKIRAIRGELPDMVKDMEDEIKGLQTRIDKCNLDIETLDAKITARKHKMEEASQIIARKEADQNNVRNNREYDALNKEIEYQKLEIELCEKNIADFTKDKNTKIEEIESAKEKLQNKRSDLEQKKSELDSIIADTRQEEDNLLKKSNELATLIDERLLNAFRRIRKNARNGLAVVTVERDACGGCFNKIPPQRQLDIKMRKKIIVCEYCGRILVDKAIDDEDSENNN